MKKILVLVGAIAAAFVMLLGSGAAVANPYDAYAGLTYAKVVERTNGRAVIASRVGSYLPTDECIVSGSRRTSFLDSSGNGGAKILVDLNCNDTMTAGHPGYSAASPEGAKAQKLKETARNINEGFAKATAAGKESWCQKNAESCANFCRRSELCSAEVVEFLGL